MAPCAALPTRSSAMRTSAISPRTSDNSDSFAILMSVQVIKNTAMTPDFSGDGVVLYQWPQDIAA